MPTGRFVLPLIRFLFFLCPSISVSIARTLGGVGTRDGVDRQRERKKRKKRARQREKSRSKKNKKAVREAHGLSTSSFFFPFSADALPLFTLMRLKKRPRLLVCAPRRLAMPAPPPPPPPAAIEEHEEESKSEEDEDEGLPCADAAARVRGGSERG